MIHSYPSFFFSAKPACSLKVSNYSHAGKTDSMYFMIFYKAKSFSMDTFFCFQLFCFVFFANILLGV